MKIIGFALLVLLYSGTAFSQVNPAAPNGLAYTTPANNSVMPGGTVFYPPRSVGELPAQAISHNSTSSVYGNSGCVVDRFGNTRVVNQGGMAIGIGGSIHQ